jgi:hypothetical protein
VPADASDDADAVAYAVEELGGLAFAYFGSEPAPALPHYDLLLANDRIRHIGVTKVPWPWLDSLATAKLGAEFLFPVTLATGTEELPALEFHVPVDDTHTLRVLCRTYLPIATERPSTEAYEIPWRPEDDDRMDAAGARGGELGHQAILEELLGQLGRTPPREAQLPSENRSNGVFRHEWGHHQSDAHLDSATVPQERLLAYMPPPTGSIVRGATTR